MTSGPCTSVLKLTVLTLLYGRLCEDGPNKLVALGRLHTLNVDSAKSCLKLNVLQGVFECWAATGHNEYMYCTKVSPDRDDAHYFVHTAGHG